MATILSLNLQLPWPCKSSGIRVRCRPPISPRNRFRCSQQLETRSPRKVSCAAAESSKSSNQLDSSDEPRSLLQELADCFALSADYFRQLPRDLWLDVGEELGEILLNISRAWELADTLASAELFCKLPVLTGSLTRYNISVLGKRLISASRRFQSMGQYGQGELQKIAKVMNRTGKIFSDGALLEIADDELKLESRFLKFEELQVELTPERAYFGAVIGFIFGY